MIESAGCQIHRFDARRTDRAGDSAEDWEEVWTHQIIPAARLAA